jgi:hypothetical protein
MAVKPTDTTGRLREKQIQENAEAMQQRAGEMAMATAAAIIAEETEVIDATKPSTATVIVDEAIIIGPESVDNIIIRVVEDVEQMTFGAGNYYSFKAGKKYRVNLDIARHLEEKGYLAGTL